jgi:hypothetical protein
MTTRPYPRTPNLALRRARQSMLLSQAQFAEAIRAAGNAMGTPNHCTKRLVQKWETGEHAACRPDYLRVLQTVTGLSARELGFRIMPDESGLSAAFDNPTITANDSDLAATFAFASSSATSHFSDQTVDEATDRLRHAVNHPSMVDARAAELVETATTRLFDLEHYSPARLLAPTVERHLTTVISLLNATRHERVRQSLMASAGRTALLAGWLAFDRGDSTSAHRLWDTSIATAEGISDGELLAATLTHESYAALRRGDPGSAWQLAHSAEQMTSDLRTTAWAITRAALSAAMLGEREAAEAAAKRSLELGEELSTPRPGDGGSPWTRSFDRGRLLSSTARTSAILGDPYAHDYATQAVDALGPAKVKSRAVVLAEAALTAAMVGELDQCLQYGSAAATLARDLNVSVAIDLLHEVIPFTLPYSDTRAVRGLLPQLSRLKRTADLQDGADPDDEEEQ